MNKHEQFVDASVFTNCNASNYRTSLLPLKIKQRIQFYSENTKVNINNCLERLSRLGVHSREQPKLQRQDLLTKQDRNQSLPLASAICCCTRKLAFSILKLSKVVKLCQKEFFVLFKGKQNLSYLGLARKRHQEKIFLQTREKWRGWRKTGGKWENQVVGMALSSLKNFRERKVFLWIIKERTNVCFQLMGTCVEILLSSWLINNWMNIYELLHGRLRAFSLERTALKQEKLWH